MADDAMPGTLQGHAERGILLRMSLVENVRESYSPPGIDVGIDLGNHRYLLLKTQDDLHQVGFATPGARTDEPDMWQPPTPQGARQEIRDSEDVGVGGLMQGARQLYRCCGVGLPVYKTR